MSLDGRPALAVSAGPQSSAGAGVPRYARYRVRVPAGAGAHTVRVAYTGAGGHLHRKRQRQEQLAAGPLWQKTGLVFST